MKHKLTTQEQKAVLEYQTGDTSKMTPALLKKVFGFLKMNVPDLQDAKVSKKDELTWVDNFINLTPKEELKSILAEDLTVDEMQKALGLLDEANIKYTYNEESEELVIESTKEEVAEAWKGAYVENAEYNTDEEFVFEDVEDNSVTVAVKFEDRINISESLAEIFGESVSKEFLVKTTKLFEAVVSAEVSKRTNAFEEEAVSAAAELIEENEAEINEALDRYATEAAEEYIRENEEAVRGSLQIELSEQFMSGLKGLFEEFNVDVPEGKVDLISDLSEEVETLKEKTEGLFESLVTVRDEKEELQKHIAIMESCRDLSESQQEQLKELVEDITYDEDFTTTLDTIKKIHFNKKSEKLDEGTTNLLEVDPYIKNTLLSFRKK